MDVSNFLFSLISESSFGVCNNLLGGNIRSVLAVVSDELVVGDSGVFEVFMMFVSCDFLVLIILSFNDCFGEGLGCIKDFLWVFNRDFVEGSLFMGFKFD